MCVSVKAMLDEDYLGQRFGSQRVRPEANIVLRSCTWGTRRLGGFFEMLLLPFKKEMLLLQFLWEVLSNGSQQGNFYPSISTLGPEENSICETIIFFREVIFSKRSYFS
jgi:hypothetical protein